MSLKTSFASVLRALRNKQNISQRDFADTTSRTYLLSKLELGKSSITLDNLDQVSRRLNLSPLTLLTLTLSEETGEPVSDLVLKLRTEMLTSNRGTVYLLATRGLVTDQDVGFLQREAEVVVRINRGEGVLLFRRYNVCVLRTESQLLKETLVALDACVWNTRPAMPWIRTLPPPPGRRHDDQRSQRPAHAGCDSPGCCREIVPERRPIAVVIAVDEPNLRQIQDRAKDHVERQTALEIPEEDYSIGSMQLH